MSATNGNGGKVRAPEGFRRIGSVADAPWFLLKEGNIVYGVLQNVYERPDDRSPTKKSKFFQIELLQECEVRQGTGEKAKVVKVGKGTVVNLNYGPKTKVIEPFVTQVVQGAEIHVWAPVLGKMPVRGGKQTMWNLDVQVNIVRPAPAAPEPDFGGGEEAGESAA